MIRIRRYRLISLGVAVLLAACGGDMSDTADELSTADSAARVTRLPGRPGAPVSSDVTDSTVGLSWSAAARATSYKVRRAPDAGGAPGAFATVASGLGGTTYQDAGLSPATTYWYRIVATNAAGDGSPSPSAAVTTAASPQPDPPPPTGTGVATVSLPTYPAQPAGTVLTVTPSLTPATATPSDVTWSTGPDCEGASAAGSLAIVNDPGVDRCEAHATTCTRTLGATIPSGAVVVALIGTSQVGGAVPVPTSANLAFTIPSGGSRSASNGAAAVATAVASRQLSAESITCRGDSATACVFVVLTGADTTALRNVASNDSANNSIASFGVQIGAQAAGSYILASFNNWNRVSASPGAATVELADQTDSADGGYWAGRSAGVTSGPGTVTISGTWVANPQSASAWNGVAIEIRPGAGTAAGCSYAAASGTATVGGTAASGLVTTSGVWTLPTAAGTYAIFAQSKDPACTDMTNGACWAYSRVTVTEASGGGTGGTGSGGDPGGGGTGGTGTVGTGTPPSGPVSGPEYFASPTGSGSTCSAASPCAISGVQSKVAGLSRPLTEEVTVTLQQGDYTTPITMGASDSGTDATRAVVWRADPNAPAGSVRLLGGRTITGWTRLDSSNGASVWSRIHPRAKNGSSSYVFFKDLGLGSYPYVFDGPGREHCDLDAVPGQDYGLNCTSGATLELYISKAPTGYTCPSGRQCPVPTRLARYPNVQADGRNTWAASWSGRTGPAIASRLPYVNHFMSVPYWTTNTAGTSTYSDGGYLYNVLEELDEAGEYWIDRSAGRAYLWPLTDADPSATGEVIVGTTAGPVLAFGSSSHHIEVRGVVIEGGQTDCVNMAGTANRLTYSTVRNCAANVITMTGSGHTVDHDALYNSGNDTIACSASASRITNNELSEFGRFRASSVAALRVGAQNLYFAHNKVHDGPAYAVYIGRAGLLMEYNDVSRLPLDGSDNGMVYTWASRDTHLDGTLRYNYFHDAPRSRTPVNWGSAAIYYDERIDQMSTYGNMFYCIGTCAGSGVAWRVGSISKGVNSYRNNVFIGLDPDQDRQILDGSGGNIGCYVADHNLFVAGGSNGSDGTDYSSLPQSGTARPACESCSPRDLSNGGGRFSSSVFSADPNGLSYIPWSSIGITP